DQAEAVPCGSDINHVAGLNRAIQTDRRERRVRELVEWHWRRLRRSDRLCKGVQLGTVPAVDAPRAPHARARAARAQRAPEVVDDERSSTAKRFDALTWKGAIAVGRVRDRRGRTVRERQRGRV